MANLYHFLADFVVVFHFVWVAALLGGWFLLRFKWYQPIHLTLLATTIISQLLFLGCPLVALENSLRMKYDPDVVYNGSFVCHYIEEYFGYQLSSGWIILALVVIALATGWVVFFGGKKNGKDKSAVPLRNE